MRHTLKSTAENFKSLWHGTRGFDIRINDRDYKAGDSFYLYEIDDKEENTGRFVGGCIELVYKSPLLIDNAVALQLNTTFRGEMPKEDSPI